MKRDTGKEVQVKICGLTRLQDIEAVNTMQADYVGFVFAPSRRQVTPVQALKLRKALSPSIMSVGVFVDEPHSNILSLVREGVIDVIQLHGSENEEYIEELKSMTNKPIIKAIAVQNKGDIEKWEQTMADYLLLDHKGGGTGQVFDWDLIEKQDITREERGKDYFLAGGLNSENITEAIRRVTGGRKDNLFAVDVSSGVETDGIKNAVKIKEFIMKVRDIGRIRDGC